MGLDTFQEHFKNDSLNVISSVQKVFSAFIVECARHQMCITAFQWWSAAVGPGVQLSGAHRHSFKATFALFKSLIYKHH